MGFALVEAAIDFLGAFILARLKSVVGSIEFGLNLEYLFGLSFVEFTEVEFSLGQIAKDFMRFGDPGKDFLGQVANLLGRVSGESIGMKDLALDIKEDCEVGGRRCGALGLVLGCVWGTVQYWCCCCGLYKLCCSRKSTKEFGLEKVNTHAKGAPTSRV